MRHRRERQIFRFVLAAGLLGIGADVAPPRADATSATCYLATSGASHALCWLDLSTYSPVTGSGSSETSGVATPLSFTLPDGSILALTMTTTVPAPKSDAFVDVLAIPIFPHPALGNSAYSGVGGKPAMWFQDPQPATTTLTGISVTDPSGKKLSTVTMAGADAESTNEAGGTIGWSSSGTGLAKMQLMNNIDGSASPVCTLSGLGTASASCSGVNPIPVAAYILSSAVTSAQSFGMTATSDAEQGYAFAADIAQLTVADAINGRSSSTDQFTVNMVRSGTTLTSASTSGTATSANASLGVFPTDTYTLSETAASGSLSNYVTTYACTNAVSSSTTLPAGTGTSVTITPALDDQISCTFTSDGLTLTNSAPATQSISAPATVTDTFTLTNTSAIAGTFTIGTIGVTGSSSGSITPSGYVYGGTTYTTLTAAQSAITAAGTTAANGSITVGVKYSAPATTQTISTTLAATIASGSGVSPSASSTVTDTAGTGLALSKTGTTATSPGGLIAWTILAMNNGPGAKNGAAFSDPVPAGLTITGTPTCGSMTGGAACGAVSVSGNVVTSTITTFPALGSVSFFINAVAGASGSYTNTATLTSGTSVTSSLTTAVAESNGLSETVRNITKGDSSGLTADTAAPGDTVQFDLSFTNTTGAALQNFRLVDPLPSTVKFASAACGALPSGVTACSATTPAVGATGTVTFSFTGTLATGNTLTATIRVVVI